MKHEATGGPSHVRTEKEMQWLIFSMKKREGIRIEPGRIFENPAQRSLAKLNSLWGKFDERLDKLAVTSLSSLHELYQYLNESLLEIHGIRVFNNGIDGTRVFSHCPRFTQGQEDQHFHSPFYRCTSSFEIERALGLFGRSCPVSRHGFHVLQMETRTRWRRIKNYLGETISELGADDYITEFVSGVAKNYGHVKKQGKSRSARIYLVGFPSLILNYLFLLVLLILLVLCRVNQFIKSG